MCVSTCAAQVHKKRVGTPHAIDFKKKKKTLKRPNQSFCLLVTKSSTLNPLHEKVSTDND